MAQICLGTGLPPTSAVPGLESSVEYQQECGIFFDAAAALQQFNRAYRDAIDSLTEIEIIADVARRHFGKVPMAVASGGTREIVEATLLTTKLLHLFNTVVTIEDVQGRGKPAPDMFLEAAGRLHVAPDCGLVWCRICCLR